MSTATMIFRPRGSLPSAVCRRDFGEERAMTTLYRPVEIIQQVAAARISERIVTEEWYVSRTRRDHLCGLK